MLKILKVYRYPSTGRLVAAVDHGNHVFPLNSDLTFSEKEPHRVGRRTRLESTPYRLEVEIQKTGKGEAYKIVRTWNEEHLPPRSTDPTAPLELRINISPSEYFCQEEREYVGEYAGHPFGMVLCVVGILFLFLIGVLGWWPPLASFLLGVVIIWATKSKGDAGKIEEVRAAKARLRRAAEERRLEAMRDVRTWVALDGVGFERAVAKIYKDRGYEVEYTPRSYDKGIDLVLRRDNKVTIVQCKRYTDRVGVSAVRELNGVRSSWPNAEEVVLASLFDFTKEAKKAAAEYSVTLFSVARDYLKSDYRPDR